MTQFNLSFAPLLPPEFLGLLAVLALIAVGLQIYARRRGAVLRALGFGLVLASLADPSLVREEREPLRDVVAVVLDKSASQSIGARMEQTARAREALEKSLGALDNVEARFIDAGAGDADGTKLFSALSAGLADVPPERIGAAIIVTDGQVHDVPASLEALGFRAPVHALITGHVGERDRRIELIEAPKFGIVGKDQIIRARVIDSRASGGPVSIQVRRDGESVSTIDTRTGEILRVPVRIAHAGPNVIEIEVAALPDELTKVNNTAVVTMEGVRDKLKVLLVSGEPHAGERMWRNLLKSDANVDLVHFTILRPPEKMDQTPVNELALIQFPTADLFGKKIKDFDLIIFDRYSNQTILPALYFDNIVRYVREGGAMLVAAGPDFSGPEGLFSSPLGKIAPAVPDGRIIEQAFRANVTEDGRKHPVTRGLAGADADPPAWSEWFRQVSASVRQGTPVMNGAGDKPLLVLSREGKGRVGLLLSDQMWLWARGYQNGGPHLDLLRRLAHWLMKEPDLEEEALRASVRGRDILIERQSLKNEAAPVSVTAPSGAVQSVTLTPGEPGLWRGVAATRELGLYKVSDGALSVLANVGPENPREFQDVLSTLEPLRAIAEASGGSVRRIGVDVGADIVMPRLAAIRADAGLSGSDYIGVHRTQASVARGIGVLPLAIGLLGLLALLGSVVAAWLNEGWRRSPTSRP